MSGSGYGRLRGVGDDPAKGLGHVREQGSELPAGEAINDRVALSMVEAAEATGELKPADP